MWIPDDEKRFSSKFRWYEVATYNRQDDRVFRLQRGPKNNRVPVFKQIDDVEQLREKYDNTGLYLSVFARSSPSIEQDNLLASLYFDFDSPELERARDDTIRTYEYLRQYLREPSSIHVFFSGRKGYHIECEALAIGISPSGNLPAVFRTIASALTEKLGLTTADFQVYDSRRMWRLTNSKHQLSGLYKVELSDELLYGDVSNTLDYATEPHEELVSEPVFEITANEWFREYVYQTERENQKVTTSFSDLVERFESGGSKVYEDKGLTFNPECFDEEQEGPHCSSLARLWNKAETTHHLEHEERLFLCSMLTYSDEARYYLHSILSNLDDYSWEKSESHIQDWIRRREYGIGGRPYSCARANSAGIGCMDCELAPRKKRVKSSNGWIEVQEEALPSPIRFCYKWE